MKLTEIFDFCTKSFYKGDKVQLAMSEQGSVTAQYLLEGAYYTLEQCGILLSDAVVLCKNRSYSSATVLAAFAREALGQTYILQELRKKVMAVQK